MQDHYLYSIEYSVDDIDCWLPDELDDVKDSPAVYRFEMRKPLLRLEITDEEFCDQINCDQKVVKSAMVSLNEQQLKCGVGARIVLCKFKCPGVEIYVGSFEMENLGCLINRLREKFNGQRLLPWKPVNTPKQPSSEIIKELVQLRSDENCTTGSIHYTLKLTCYGSVVNKVQFDSLCEQDKGLSEVKRGARCAKNSEDIGFQEYSAEINGNALVVRVNKDSHRVTRVFDCETDRDGRAIQEDKNVISIRGCEQQIDFKMPEKFSSGDCIPKQKNCSCEPRSVLTDFQRRTSCIGKSFKNSCVLPVIRGNLKYPGRLDGSVNFDLFDKCNSIDASQKYLKKPSVSSNVCSQVDRKSIQRELEGKCQLPQGIQVSRKCCSVPNTDVFVLKIGSKRTDKPGKNSEIELEMRTPKGPEFEPKQLETRESQYEEKDFQIHAKPEKSAPTKKPLGPTTRKTVVKKEQKVVSKGFVKANK